MKKIHSATFFYNKKGTEEGSLLSKRLIYWILIGIIFIIIWFIVNGIIRKLLTLY